MTFLPKMILGLIASFSAIAMADSNQQPEKRFHLLGVIASTIPGGSMAVLWDKETKSSISVKEGSILSNENNLIVSSISMNHVTFLQNGRKKLIGYEKKSHDKHQEIIEEHLATLLFATTSSSQNDAKENE